MIGFLFGAACLFGLAKMIRRGRCGYGRGWGGHGGGCGSSCGGGYGHGGYEGDWGGRGDYGHHGGSWWHRGGHGWGRGPGNFFLRRLFMRLETTPGQERVIVQAVEEVREALRQKRPEIHASREDVAKILNNATFDESAVGSMFSRHDDALRSVRLAFTGALAKIHEVLTPEQRQQLADLISRGPGFFAQGGPYRA